MSANYLMIRKYQTPPQPPYPDRQLFNEEQIMSAPAMFKCTAIAVYVLLLFP